MTVELICVGSELLSGDVVNTNASYISEKLREFGHNLYRIYTVDDNKERLSEQIVQSLGRCDVLILTGGLGPTADDITKETTCSVLGIPLVENELCLNHLENYYKAINKKPPENNFKQTLAPEDAIILPNKLGTACGIIIEYSGKQIILLPGPPKELIYMFENYVTPYLKNMVHHSIVTHTLNIFGMGESAVETLIRPLCEKENPFVATYCSNNECSVKITATADDMQTAKNICSKTMNQIKELLGDCVYGIDSDGLANEVVDALRSSGLKISTAESCTGGMLSESLTSVPHSSEVVEIGILAYSNRIKHEALSVPRDVLEESGSISSETAMYLAKNVRILSDSDIGVGITGNAGPGASDGKPVGLVYVAIADRTKYFVKKLKLPALYDREKIRSYATLTALDLVRKYVACRPSTLPGMVTFDSEFHFDEDEPEIKTPAIIEQNENFAVFETDHDKEDTVVEKPEDNSICVFAQEDMTDSEETDKEKPKVSFFSKFGSAVRNMLPKKNNRVVDVLVKIIAIISSLCLVVSSAALINHFAFEYSQRNIIEDAREDFEYDNQTLNSQTQQYSIFDSLITQNPDVRAWISISNTNVNNPVYQSDDNDYYLKHNMLKKKSRYGALFFDYQNKISSDGNSKNLTIYGHNTSDKSMFGTLRYYRKLSFYKSNPIIKLKTLYDQSEYIIFAVMITNASAEDDNGHIYNYTRSEFSSDDDFMSWIAQANEKSFIDTGIAIQPDDEILTLSTCCYDFDNARFVIMAKKLQKDDAVPDVSKAKLNSNTRYPQAWYDKKGLDGYVNPDTESSKVSQPANNSAITPSADTTSDISSEQNSSSATVGSSSVVSSSSVISSSNANDSSATSSDASSVENSTSDTQQ